MKVFGDEDDQESTAGFPPFLEHGRLNRDSPDAKDIAVGTLRLRAERKGNGDGRVYLIVVKATDSSGNTRVQLLHDGGAALHQGVRPDLGSQQAAAARNFCLAHDGTPPAGYFVVGDGPVIGPKQ